MPTEAEGNAARGASPERAQEKKVVNAGGAASSGARYTSAEDRLVLLVVDPYWCLAYWRVHPRTLELSRLRAGGSAFPVLRIHEASGADESRAGTAGEASAGRSFDLSIELAEGRRYIDFWSPGKSVIAELGYAAPDGSFASAVRSNSIDLPPAGESPFYEDRRARVRGEPSRLWKLRSAARSVEEIRVADAALGWDEGEREGEQAVVAEAGETVGEGTAVSIVPVSIVPATSATELGPAVDAAPGDGGDSAVAAIPDAWRPTAPHPAVGASIPAQAATLGAPPATSAPSSEAASTGPVSLATVPSHLAGIGVSSFVSPPEPPRSRLEIRADVVIYGTAQPNTEVVIDGVVVPVRRDGTFDIRFALTAPDAAWGAPVGSVARAFPRGVAGGDLP